MSTIEYVDLACTKAALVKNANPTNNYHGAEEYQIVAPGDPYFDNYLLLAFEELSGVYRYRNIYGVYFNVTADRNLSSSNSLFFSSLKTAFDENTVTWANLPQTDKNYYNGASVSDGSGDVAASVAARIYNADSSVAYLNAVSAPGIKVQAGIGVSGSGKYLKIYTNVATSGKRPYLHVAVSDTPAVVKVTKTAPSTTEMLNCLNPITFSWDIKFLNEGGVGFTRPIADIEQTSAVLYWREVGAENWNSISVSGNVRSVTVPANTFPGRDIQWRIAPVVTGYTVSGDATYQTARLRIYSDAAATGLAGVDTLNPDETLSWTGSFTTTTIDYTIGTDFYKNLLVAFSELPSAYRYKAIQSAGVAFESVIGAGDKKGVQLFQLETGFDASSVTWNTKPAKGEGSSAYDYDNTAGTGVVRVYPYIQLIFASAGLSESGIKATSHDGLKCLQSPAFMLQAFPWENHRDMGYKIGAFGISPPVVRRAILIDVTVTSKPQAAKYAAGYVNPHVAQIFEWDLVPDGDYYCFGEWAQASATFYWRNGTSGNWTSVPISGPAQQATLAAETMGSGDVQWYVTVTDDQGTTASSEIYTITTVDAETTATPIAPSGTIEDGSKPISFTWGAANDYGTPQGGATLEYSTDGETWTTFATVTGSATSYDAPAGTFSAGTVYWRVKASNVDGVDGPTSDPLVFVCMAAPPAPVVSADDVPFATISWQSETQQAYRVRIDGVLYGPFFGTGKTFTVSAYLENGGHTAEVEVQNSFGLWSDPGTVTFTVTNVPGNPITLRGSFDRDAVLSWETEATAADFYVYRDGVQIGHTAGTGFTDRFVLGEHAYFVINRLPGGYYTKSNTVSGTMRSCVSAIALLEGGDWMELKLSENSETVQSFSYSRTASLRHVLGAELPVIETSPFRDGSASYDVSFADLSAAQRFESYRGALVIVKSRGGNVVIGFVSAMSKRMTDFYIAYNFSVTRIHWEDYIDETRA